ncbi:Polyadenylate-binding protein like [Argiope bruennichi]|uniref:Polyadenylate-binding protein like n=1 Tax=Argiope bruennichi TaxID=94029 RepID=A0A8T0EKC6_ARGBR|nr:Polyadenylate-binding protein like [Argiope bruennichi]
MPRMIFIENLYPKVDVTDLCKEFGKYGRILSAKIEYGKNFTSLGKGCICYFDSTSADIAVKKMNGKKTLGSALHVTVVQCEKQESHSEVSQIDHAKIFVNNLDFRWDDCDLIKIFELFGDIDEIKISTTDGKSNGYGFVKFSQPASATRAIKEMNNLPENERKLVVEPFIPWELREKPRQSLEFAKIHAVEWNNLHVKNLDIDMTEDDLKKLFQPFGSIISVKIPVDESGKSRGFGFVCFEKEEDAAKALDRMGNYRYKSKCLEVNFNQKKSARQKYLRAIKTDPQIRKFKGGKEIA